MEPHRSYFNQSSESRSAYCLGAVLQSDLMGVWNLLDWVLDWKVKMRVRKH